MLHTKSSERFDTNSRYLLGLPGLEGIRGYKPQPTAFSVSSFLWDFLTGDWFLSGILVHLNVFNVGLNDT